MPGPTLDFPNQFVYTDPIWLLGANASKPAKTPITSVGRALIAAEDAAAQRAILGAAAEAYTNPAAPSVTTVNQALDALFAGQGGGGSSDTFTQVAHGFTTADIGRPLRFNGTTWVYAQANSAVNAESPGLLSAVLSPDEFTITYVGPINGLPPTMIPGEVYFLGEALAGSLTLLAPSAPGSVDKPMLLIVGPSRGVVLQMRGFLVPTTSTGAASGTTYLAAFNHVTPLLVYEVPAGQALDTIDIEVTEAWNGVGAQIQVGTLAQPGRFFNSAETELAELGAFSKNFSELGLVQIYITITPGFGATAGKARLQITTTPTGT